MSCGPPLLPERVSQVVDERKKAEKRVSDLEAELAEHIALGLLSQQTVNAKAAPSDHLVSHLHRTDDSGNSLGFLSAIASLLACKAEEKVDPTRRYLFVLSSSPSMQTPNTSNVVLVVGSDEQMVKVIGDALKTKVGVKGGGKGPRWSGKHIGVWKSAKEGVAISEILQQSFQTN